MDGLHKFGHTLKVIREYHGKGVRETAKLLKIDPANYQRLESGKLAPPNTGLKVIELVRPLDLPNVKLKELCDSALEFHVTRLRNKFTKV
jgi:hypothetical protein